MMLFEEAIAFYLHWKKQRGKGVERDEYSLKRLVPHFAGKGLREIRRRDVRAYVDVRLSESAAPATVNRELKLPSAAVNIVRVELEVELPNPFEAVGLSEGEGRVRWISRQEATALVLAARGRWPHLSSFIELGLNTGCRRNELLALEWRRVDVDRGLLLFEARHTKSRRRRTVPLNDAARRALDRLRDWVGLHAPGSPWVFGRPGGGRLQTVQKGFKAACERAGVEDFRVHDLRHTCASWLVMAGVSLYVVRDLLGHSSITVTERYAHLAPEQVREAVQLILPLTQVLENT
ncbi:MAG TPA: site-specific integrase [Burkholderiales bacterium]|nr:site-specific integrase [Burkholderiales bacterium]